ncbi:MAG: hypothetical protein IPG53_14200 [Ignavibacteriales bacterium]|nr:hypothetical protein [Ignavibacteriales bacterium]
MLFGVIEPILPVSYIFFNAEAATNRNSKGLAEGNPFVITLEGIRDRNLLFEA